MQQAILQTIANDVRHLLCVFAFAVFMSPAAHALEVGGETVSQADISMLIPVCRFIMIERPGIHLKGGDGPLGTDAPLLDRPEYAMARHNATLHHYCWALIHKMRYFRARTTHEKNFRFTQFMNDTDFVLRKSPKDWQYFHIVLIEQAKMMKIRGNYPYSLLKINEALEYKPDYERTYALKSDVYLDMDDKKKAIEAVEEGLKNIPQSRFLRRQLEKLGGNVPPLPEPVADNSNKGTSGEGTLGGSAYEQQVNEADASNNGSIGSPETVKTTVDTVLKSDIPSTDDSTGNTATGSDSLPDGKSYCRFCP